MHGIHALSDARRSLHHGSSRKPASNAPAIAATARGVLCDWSRPAVARKPHSLVSNASGSPEWCAAVHVLDDCQEQLQQPEQLCSEQNLDLLVLDALLASLTALVAACGFAVTCSGDVQATLLYAQARQLQQQLCNNMDIYACLAIMIEQAQAQTSKHGGAHLGQELSGTGTPCSPDQQLLLLRRMLWHLQSKGDCCLVDAGSALTPAEQQLRYADARSKGQALLQQLSRLLQDANASPQVDVDAASLQVLLHPIQAALDAQSASGGSVSLQHTSPGAAAPGLNDVPTSQLLDPSIPAAAAPGAAEASAMISKGGGLLLTPGLVQVVLQSHPDPEVRQQVYAAGVLQRLDAVVYVWQQQAEVQRRVARSHGQPSAAALYLPRTLLGSTAAVQRFLLHLGEAIQEPAQRQLQDLGLPGAAEAWELEYAAAQVQQARAECLTSYADHLHLPTCLRHISSLLQPLLGVTLREVQQGAPSNSTINAGGNTAGAAGGLLVFEVWAHDACHDRGSTQAGGNRAAGTERTQCTQARDRLDQTERTGLPSAPSSSSSGKGHNVGEDNQNHETHEPAAAPTAANTSTRLLGHVVISFGNRQSVTQLAPPGYGVSLRDLGVTTAAVTAEHTDSLPVVMVSLQSQAASSSITSGALGLWEACHELGHALHFCLSARSAGSISDHGTECGDVDAAARPPLSSSSNSSGSTSSSRPLSGIPYHLQAPWLPVEVLELPSSFLEHLVMSPECLALVARHRVTGAPLPSAAAGKLAAQIKDTYYSPLGLQHMVRLMLVDQELLMWTKPWGGRTSTSPQAAEAWAATQALGAAPASICLLQQLQALPLVMRLPGQAHGYLVGWYLSLLLWEACRQTRAQAPAAAPLVGADSGTPAAQGLQGVHLEGMGDVDIGHGAGSLFNPAACTCIRRYLFDRRADVAPATLLAELMQQLADGAQPDRNPTAAGLDAAATEAARQGTVSVDLLVVARWFK